MEQEKEKSPRKRKLGKKKPEKILDLRTEGLHKIAIIDQSYAHAGLCVIDLDTGKILSCPNIHYDRKATNSEKRRVQSIAINQLVNLFHCDAIVCEEPRMFPSAQTKARLHEILAVISSNASVPVYMVNTTSWRSLTIGSRGLKDDSMMYAVGLGWKVDDNDSGDAICIADAVCKGVRLKKFD